MSYISVKELSAIRKLVTERRQQILSEIEDKKTITKKQCQTYVEELCDLVISYDPVFTSATQQMQPFIKLVDIDSNKSKVSAVSSPPMPSTSAKADEKDDDWDNDWSTEPQFENKSVTKNVKTTETVINLESSDNTDDEVKEVVAKSNASDNKPVKDGVRYKGVIRGMDSLKNGGTGNDDDWGDWDTELKESPPKKAKTTRKTRSTNKSTNDKTDENVTEWSVGGQVLGGDSIKDTESLTHEEKRRLLAEKTEQRIANMTKRGAKGVVKLTTRAKSDINSPDVSQPKSNLHWKL